MDAAPGTLDERACGIVRLAEALEHGPKAVHNAVLLESIDIENTSIVDQRVWCSLCGVVVHRTKGRRHLAQHSEHFKVDSDPEGLRKLQAAVTLQYGILHSLHTTRVLCMHVHMRSALRSHELASAAASL